MSEAKRYRILVVEDEADGQQVLSDILDFHEMDCDTFATAEEGLDALKKSIYDAVIIDLGLPGMHGFDLLKRIKAVQDDDKLPCIAYTAFHNSKVRAEALSAGFSAYLQKPVGQDHFIATLKRLLREANPDVPLTYEDIAKDYTAWVDAQLDDSHSFLSTARRALIESVGDVTDLALCDLGCGEGHLARHYADKAKSITGIDRAYSLVEIARTRIPAEQVISFVRDDAQELSTQANNSFDLVFANASLMDMPDLKAVYRTVFRVLKPGGRFVFTITHPAFQSPQATSTPTTREITRYATEGMWRSDHIEGIRGKVGAYHRTFATYLNEAIKAGFLLNAISEPRSFDSTIVGDPIDVEIPAVLLVDLTKNQPSPEEPPQ